MRSRLGPGAFRKRAGWIVGAAVIAAALSLTGFWVTAASPAGAPARTLGRVVVIVFENKASSEILANKNAATFRSLARHYALISNYHAVSHPSLPNYLALVSGSTHGIVSDCTSCTVTGANLADTLAAAGKTWKSYAEDLPHPGFTGATAGSYDKAHEPFLYFTDVLRSPTRRNSVVPLTSFHRDLVRGTVPDFSLVVPNVCHDMDVCSVAKGDSWLHGFLRPLLGSAAMKAGVVFIVFDESSHSGGTDGDRVVALAVGPAVARGARATAWLNHYSLLHTIELRWHLRPLGLTAKAPPIVGIWR